MPNLPVWSLIIHNKHMLKLHRFGENQEGGISFQRSLCTWNITRSALHSLPTPPASPMPYYIPTTSLSHCKKCLSSLQQHHFCRHSEVKRHRKQWWGAQQHSLGPMEGQGQKLPGTSKGLGVCPAPPALAVRAAPSGPHPRFGDTASAGPLQVTLH